MNLTMDALRLVVVKALRGRTWVGPAVFDSPASPSSVDVRSPRSSFISVYVDESDNELGETGSMGNVGDGSSTRLIIEIGVASPHKFNAQGQRMADGAPLPADGFVATQLDATSEGLEMQMGLIGRQAIDALTSTNVANPWAEMFRIFTAGSIQRVDIRRGGPSNDQKAPAPRYASRVMIIHVSTLGEPPRGADLEDWPFWKMFFEACEGDEEYGEVAALIRAHIERPTGELPDWRLAQKVLHIPRETAAILGITPLPPTDETAATLSEITLQDKGHRDGF